MSHDHDDPISRGLVGGGEIALKINPFMARSRITVPKFDYEIMPIMRIKSKTLLLPMERLRISISIHLINLLAT